VPVPIQPAFGPQEDKVRREDRRKPPPKRLNSWKEIAAHLKCGERTAKRWEKTRALPIRRLPGGPGLVFALTSEIEAWQLSNARSEDAVGSSDAEQHLLPDETRSPTPGSAATVPSTRRLLTGLALLALSVALVFGFIWRHRGKPAATARPHITTQQARNLYLSGRFYWNKRTAADLQLAMRDFQAAAALDPRYAAAYAGIADCYALSPEFAAMSPQQAYPKMLEAARRSVALDPNLPEAHRALGFVLFYWNWDRAGSRREFERALALDPHNSTTFHWFANMLMQSQDRAAALKMIDKARELDPTSPALLADRGLILSWNNQKKQAIEIWQGLERSDPSYLPSHRYALKEYLYGHNPVAYLAELRAIAQVTRARADADELAACQEAFLHHGEDGLLQVVADEHIRDVQRSGFGYLEAANILDLAHRKDAALDYVEMAYKHRDPEFPTLSNLESFSDLVGNPKFDDLRSRSRLPFPENRPASLSETSSASGSPAPLPATRSPTKRERSHRAPLLGSYCPVDPNPATLRGASSRVSVSSNTA